MSSLFGQVWLWSLLSFVAGVALTWLVLVRPAKRELEDLEERLLASPRPAPQASAASSVGLKSQPRDEFDNWHVEASRSLADDVLTPERTRFEAPLEPTRYESSGFESSGHESSVEAPRYDMSNIKLDERDSLLEELDDEHRPLSDFEEQHDFPEFEAEPPRRMFDRLSPEAGHDTRETLEPRPRSLVEQSRPPLEPPPFKPSPRPRQYTPDDEPELPAEATQLMPVVPPTPVAEVAPPQEEPTAPPEVQVFQPREVWREEPVQEVYDEDEVAGGHEEEDEPERRPASAEETALIPATALAQAIAEVDNEQRRPAEPETEPEQEPQVWSEERRRPAEPEPQVWPEHDLTGHFSPVDVESTRGELSERTAEASRSEALRSEAARSEAFHSEISRNEASRSDVLRSDASRNEASRGEAPPRSEVSRSDEPSNDLFRNDGPRTEVMSAIVDSPPVESKPEIVEPTALAEPVAEPVAAPEPPRAPEPAVVEPVAPAEPEVKAPAPVEPPAFEPTFVQPSSQPVKPQPVEPKAAEPKPAEVKPAEAKPVEPKPAEAKVEPKKDEPTRPRSLFEPLLDTDEEPEPEQTRPTPPPASGNDQPFVPTLSPELLAGNPTPLTANGLPQRPTRPTGSPRTPSPAPLSPKPATPPPPPPLPVRPRPVGFSPSTGGRPAAASGNSPRYQGQQEGFNPRSPFGPGSVLPKSDGLAPAPEFQVKATLTGRRYFTNESANFRETRADVWFRTTSDAEKAGFRQAP
nr:hypothetical protein [Saccharothrix sp. ALI-22-I]